MAVLGDQLETKIRQDLKTTGDYDAQALEAILRSYGISEGPEKANLCHSATTYFYSIRHMQEDFLLRDQINFILHHRNNFRIYICRHFSVVITAHEDKKLYALLVKLSGCDLNQLANITRELETFKLTSYETVLKNVDIVKRIKRLYGKKEFKWIGSSLLKPALDALLPRIAKAYVGNIDLKPVSLPDENRHIHFTVCILTELGFVQHKIQQEKEIRGTEETQIAQNAQGSNRTIVSIKEAHAQILRKHFIFRMQDRANEEIIARLSVNLTIIYKYCLVRFHISNLRKDIAGENKGPSEMEEIIQKVKLIKILTYKKEFSLYEVSKSFSFNYLLRLHKALDDVASFHILMETLNEQRKEYLGRIYQLEQNFNQLFEKRLGRGASYVKYYTTKIIHFIYQTTLIEFGGSALRFLTKSCSKRLNNNPLLQRSRSIAKKFIRWSLKDQRHAEKWIHDFEHAIEKYLTIDSAMYLVGAGIGTWLSTGASSYTMLRQILLAALSMKLYNKIQDARIHDETASYSENLDAITPLHCAYLMQVLLVVTEYHYTKDLRYVITALGGLTGGTVTVLLVNRALPGFANPTTAELAKEASIIKFFLNLGGHTVGYQLTDSFVFRVEAIIERSAIRSEFLNYIQRLQSEGRFAELEAHADQSLLSSAALLGNAKDNAADNKVFLGWRYKCDSRWYKTQCQLQRKVVPGVGSVIDVSCDVPTLSLPGLSS